MLQLLAYNRMTEAKGMEDEPDIEECSPWPAMVNWILPLGLLTE
jgi:hypothetical protein